jgi:hypothetical protein
MVRNEAKVIGAVKPLPTGSCFGLPILLDDNTYIVQDFDSDGIITAFRPIIINNLEIITWESDTICKIGEPARYVYFQNGKHVALGSRDELEAWFHQAMPDLSSSPFLQIEVMKFLRKYDQIESAILDASRYLSEVSPTAAVKWRDQNIRLVRSEATREFRKWGYSLDRGADHNTIIDGISVSSLNGKKVTISVDGLTNLGISRDLFGRFWKTYCSSSSGPIEARHVPYRREGEAPANVISSKASADDEAFDAQKWRKEWTNQPGDSLLRIAALRWLSSNDFNSDNWRGIWKLLWKKSRGDITLYELGRNWLFEVNPSNPGWGPMWRDLSACDEEDQFVLDVGLKWLSAEMTTNPSWGPVWRRLFQISAQRSLAEGLGLTIGSSSVPLLIVVSAIRLRPGSPAIVVHKSNHTSNVFLLSLGSASSARKPNSTNDWLYLSSLQSLPQTISQPADFSPICRSRS